ncbi:MAG: hypothetical protein ABIU54_05230 [Candidatus Eisenbacteria bacterium]
MKRHRMMWAWVATALLSATPARAYFEEVQVGARALALGSGAIAAVNDGSAYYWNPAALSELRRGEGLVDYSKPYGLGDVNAGALVLSAPYAGAGWALAWHHLGLTDVYSEDLFCASVGRRIKRFGNGHAVSGGATFKFGRASFQPFEDRTSGISTNYGTVSKGSFDAGLRWATPWNIDFAYVSRDLLEPRYQFVPGSGGQLLVARQELAAAFHWNRESTITLGWSQLDSRRTSLSAGLEVLFYDVFAIRSSIANLSRVYDSYASPNELQFNGGFGVFHKNYQVDATASTNRDLGASYRVTLRVPLYGGDAR